MKTFAFHRVNPQDKCEKEKINVYRIKNNLPVFIGTTIRSYRDPEQAAVEWLTNNGHMRAPRENEMRYSAGRFFHNKIDQKLLAKVRIVEF